MAPKQRIFAQRLLFVVYCIALVSGKSETTTETVPPTSAEQSVIANLQNQLNEINVNELLASISNQGTELSTAKAELTEIAQRVSSFEQQEKDLNALQSALDSTNEALNALDERMQTNENAAVQHLSARIKKVENDQLAQKQQALGAKSQQKDSTSSKDVKAIQSRIESLSKSMSREISDNSKRLEIMEESVAQNEVAAIKNAIQSLSDRLDAMQKRTDEDMRSIADRITKFDKNLQTVYDATLAAALDKMMTATLEYLDIFGNYIVSSMVDLRQYMHDIDWKAHWLTVRAFVMNTFNAMKAKLQEIEWKELYERAMNEAKALYERVRTTEQLRLAKEWMLDLYAYIRFWWIEGIQPAIIYQATNLYLGIQTFTKESIAFVHSHFMYHELLVQLTPFLKMANIPAQYNGYVLDAVLVMFCLSSLMTLSFLCGICCDCCCPRKPLLEEDRTPAHTATGSGSNSVKNNNKSKSPSRNNKSKKKRSRK